MKITEHDGITLYDLESPLESFREEVLEGLTRPAKLLPPKFFYDDLGAQLFEQICDLPEYYPTRTETAILRENIDEIAGILGRGCLIVEFGSGASSKTRILLDRLPAPAGYVPIDVAKSQLIEMATILSRAYPGLEIMPVCADYMGDLRLPTPVQAPTRVVAFFPGSTIGNLEPSDVHAFLKRVAALCGSAGGLLIGVDLEKDPRIIEPAYNDAQGVTAAFNLNVLQHINRELGADFDLAGFQHQAKYDPAERRIEMRLISRRPQEVRVAGKAIDFVEQEAITTEYSYKYSLARFRAAAESAGWSVRRVWTDAQQLFSVQYLEVVAPSSNGHAHPSLEASGESR
jgi:L-histidine N-alpha-methyltransferase